MADINVKRDSKLVKLMAARVKNERIDSAQLEESNRIINELAQDMSPANRHQIAQIVGYTIDELQQHELDFLNTVADQKNIGYGDKAAFRVKTEGIKAYIQAKGSTTARSYVADKQVLLSTEEVSARPAINLMDLRTGRVNMADLIREANSEMTLKKLEKVQSVLHDAVSTYASPFYGTGTGVNKSVLDAQINYFRRLGPVTILGDIAAVGQMTSLSGMAMNSGDVVYMQRSDSMLDEANRNGYIGRYNACDVVAMTNAYRTGTTTPILDVNYLYIIPGGMTGDARNLKIVNEGSVSSVEGQDINDMVYEIRLDQWFGVGFVSGRLPTIGAYKIG